MLIKNVLVKLIRGGRTDRVLFIDNVPQELFYEMKHPVICEGKGQEQHWVPDTSKEKIPTLYPDLEKSQVGDNGIVFNMENENSLQRWLTVDRYIKSMYPSSKVIPQAVVNSVEPKNTAASPLALSDVPRVVLPSLSPSEAKPSVEGVTTASLDVEAIKKEAIAQYEKEQKEKNKERMAKAREARAIKS